MARRDGNDLGFSYPAAAEHCERRRPAGGHTATAGGQVSQRQNQIPRLPDRLVRGARRTHRTPAADCSDPAAPCCRRWCGAGGAE